MSHTEKLDPYGKLEYVIGSEDDFVCFDFEINRRRKTVTIASTVNSETGGFIQAFEPTFTVSYADDLLAPYRAAQELAGRALDWCAEGGDPIEHDEQGWGQSPLYFARAIHAAVTRAKEPAARYEAAMQYRPLSTRNYL